MLTFDHEITSSTVFSQRGKDLSEPEYCSEDGETCPEAKRSRERDPLGGWD